MHELGLAQGILAVTLEVAGGEPVHRVVVRVGRQQAIDADSLAFSFGLLAAETPAAHARLDVRACAGVDVLIDEVECGNDPRQVMRRPDLVAGETAHAHEHADPHQGARAHEGLDHEPRIERPDAHEGLDHAPGIESTDAQNEGDQHAVHPAWR